MPVRPLPLNPNLDHLKAQAKDLLKARARCEPAMAQLIREFHPRFQDAADSAIFEAAFGLSDAQLTIARKSGFSDWARLKRHTGHTSRGNDLGRKHHERIEDPPFRRAVELLDEGDTAALRDHLREHPDLARQHVVFEGENYFQNPALLGFVAENPIRHGTLPRNIAEVATVILDAGAKQDSAAVNETLALVSSGAVARQCGVQVLLIDLLCDYGADPDRAMGSALAHGEFSAVHALIRRGAKVDVATAAACNDTAGVERLVAGANGEDRHRALALAAQFGHAGIVRLLLDAGEDPSRYNPRHCHSHSTPLHQAALAGHAEVVHLLVERGARLDTKDTMWLATPAMWAKYGGHGDIEAYLTGRTISP